MTQILVYCTYQSLIHFGFIKERSSWGAHPHDIHYDNKDVILQIIASAQRHSIFATVKSSYKGTITSASVNYKTTTYVQRYLLNETEWIGNSVRR